MIFIETELFEHKCLFLIFCLSVLLIKLYTQNLAETSDLFLEGMPSGTFMDPYRFAYSLQYILLD